MTVYCSNRFAPGIWINGCYVTGLTVAEAQEQLLQNDQATRFVLNFPNEESVVLSLNYDICHYSMDTSLKNRLQKQKPFNWFSGVFNPLDITISPEVIVENEALKSTLSELDQVKRIHDDSCKFSVTYSKEGVQITDTLTSHLDLDLLTEAVSDALASGANKLQVPGTCYVQDQYTAEQLEELSFYNDLKDFLQCDLVYDMGDELVPVSEEKMYSFLALENGKPVASDLYGYILDTDSVDAFVDSLCELYDTYKKEDYEFAATRGETVIVKRGTYGTKLDAQEEKKYLRDALIDPRYHDGVQDVHTPKYLHETAVHGKNDIGDTYVEVDMGMQKLYLYEDGVMTLSTDIVTGNMRYHYDTPTGVYALYFMQRDRVLIGANYRTPVKYWMAVTGHIGIHDADWRDKFGGDIYLTNGSHGCINVPKEIAPDIYAKVEVGTPVVLFY